MPISHQQRDDAVRAASDNEPVDDAKTAPDAHPKTDRQADAEAGTTSPAQRVDQEGQAAVEGRDPERPPGNRRAIEVKFGVDPENLYDAPNDEESRDHAVRDLD